MATISMKTMAAALVANAATVGTATSLTTANCQALGAIATLVADRPHLFHEIHKLLSDTHKASISSAQ